MIELSESEKGLMQEEWDAFSRENRTDITQSTFARYIAKAAFVWAYTAGVQHERERKEAT